MPLAGETSGTHSEIELPRTRLLREGLRSRHPGVRKTEQHRLRPLREMRERLPDESDPVRLGPAVYKPQKRFRHGSELIHPPHT